jgi:hypothetical protein
MASRSLPSTHEFLCVETRFRFVARFGTDPAGDLLHAEIVHAEVRVLAASQLTVR